MLNEVYDTTFWVRNEEMRRVALNRSRVDDPAVTLGEKSSITVKHYYE